MTKLICAGHIADSHKAKLGYMGWHHAATVSKAKGEKQTQCSECSRWYFPWERVPHEGERAITRTEDSPMLNTNVIKEAARLSTRGTDFVLSVPDPDVENSLWVAYFQPRELGGLIAPDVVGEGPTPEAALNMLIVNQKKYLRQEADRAEGIARDLRTKLEKNR